MNEESDRPQYPDPPTLNAWVVGLCETALPSTWVTPSTHTIQGGLSVDRTKVPGLGSERNVGASLSYVYKPNKQTSFTAGVQHSRGGGGRSNSFGLGFSHTFDRKRRATENL
ncbi:uncharacterized protein [Procambarus clarkii]|uniref:uncharacterized protein n=1 Tax=Procambarus clarkii TaxID=6728 RepID=UPI003743AB40